MRATFLLVLSAMSLAGCATVQTRACENKEALAVGFDLALTKAYEIADPVKREAAVGAIRTSLAAFNKRCGVQ